jgi:catalase
MRFGKELTLGLLLTVGVAAGAVAADPPLPVRLVDQFYAMFGSHPGFRANHAKGIVFEGTFTPSPGAKTLSSAAHLQDTAVPVTIRFSNGGGLPDAPDTHPSGLTRGMAIKFHLPSGADTDIVAISTNGFPVSNGEDFLLLLKALAASGPSSPKPTPLEGFLSTHPSTAKALSVPQRIPTTYANLPYFGVNAFSFTNAQGVSKFGRYQIVPEAGEAYLSEADAAKQPPNFLSDGTRALVAKGPVKFKLLVQLADPGDVITDATQVWPDSRTKVELGEIAITKLDPDSLAAEKKLLFVPTNVTPGIAPSADPLLPVRAAAYGVSFGRRSKP